MSTPVSSFPAPLVSSHAVSAMLPPAPLVRPTAVSASLPLLPPPPVAPTRIPLSGGMELGFTRVAGIDVLPTGDITPRPSTTYSVGDTHGNAIALFRYIHSMGLVKIEQPSYSELLAIYGQPVASLTRDNLNRFRTILAESFRAVEASTDVTGVKVRLFGDLLADRGSNDIFTLMLLDEFKKRYPDINTVILLSNHDKAFLRVYLDGSLFDASVSEAALQTDFMVGARYAVQATSVRNLKSLINRSLVSQAEVTEMMNAAYLPFLTLIDYTLRGREIDIMSHAPLEYCYIIGLTPDSTKIALGLSSGMIPTIAMLPVMLDAINDQFKPTLEPTTGSYGFSSEVTRCLITVPAAGNPLRCITMARQEDIRRLRTACQCMTPIDYTIRFRHGHDGSTSVSHISGIDYVSYNNEFGKEGPRLFSGEAEGFASQSPDGGVPDPTHSSLVGGASSPGSVPPPPKRLRI